AGACPRGGCPRGGGRMSSSPRHPARRPPATPGEPCALGEFIGAKGPPAKTNTPPRGWRAAWLVSPSMNSIENMGLTSRDFMRVISGLAMMAQLSPRDCGKQFPVRLFELVETPLPGWTEAVEVMHLF